MAMQWNVIEAPNLSPTEPVSIAKDQTEWKKQASIL